MSRHVRELPVQDLLARFARVPSGRLPAEGQVPVGRPRQLPEQEQRGLQPQDGGVEQRKGGQRRTGRRAETEPVQGAGLLREVARLLRAGPVSGLAGHAGTPLQQDEPRHGQLQLAVLRPRTQHPEADAQRALQLSLPLVLLRAVRGVPPHRVGQRVQVVVTSLSQDPPTFLPLPARPHPTFPVLSVVFAPCVTLAENLFTPPFPFCRPLIWILFSLCSRCYSQNAKSEIEEVTHVSCLVWGQFPRCSASQPMRASRPSCPTKTKTDSEINTHIVVQ